LVLVAGCNLNGPLDLADLSGDGLAQAQAGSTLLVPLGASSTFAVLGGTTVTSAGATVISGDLGVSPGTAITGFEPTNNIMGPGTVTPGLGVVDGTIYASGPVAAAAHNDAVLAYNYLMAQVPDTMFAGVTQLDGMTLTPGVYNFAPSANLLANGTLTLDFQGDSDALFIFQAGTTVVTTAGSQIVAINTSNDTCSGANVYWAVGSSATIDGDQFIGSVIANTTITMVSGGAVAGRVIALNGAVTLIENGIAVCGGTDGTGGGTDPPVVRDDRVTGGGWIEGTANNGDNDSRDNDSRDHNSRDNNSRDNNSRDNNSRDNNSRDNNSRDNNSRDNNSRDNRVKKGDRVTFAISAGIQHGEFRGNLSFDDHGSRGNRVKLKSTSITGYIVVDAVTRQIEGTARIGRGETVTFTVVVADNGESGREDTFSIELSNGYSASGTLLGGNIQLHIE
jgi:hypothetical protein